MYINLINSEKYLEHKIGLNYVGATDGPFANNNYKTHEKQIK